MDQNEFNELHSRCVSVFREYADQAEVTASTLANCTAEPMPLGERLKIALQVRIENTSHSLYRSAKFLLHEALVPAPAGISPTPTAEQKQNKKNDQ